MNKEQQNEELGDYFKEVKKLKNTFIFGKEISVFEYEQRYCTAVTNWITNVIMNYLDVEKVGIDEFSKRYSHEDFVELIHITEFYSDVIYFSRGKEVFDEMLKTNKNPWEIIYEMGFLDENDVDLRMLILKSIETNEIQFEKYINGNKNMKNFFVGDIMKNYKNKINIKKLGDLLDIILNENK